MVKKIQNRLQYPQQKKIFLQKPFSESPYRVMANLLDSNIVVN